MENAASALKMAAAILIFIIAISCSFSLFGTAKRTADSIIGIKDKQAYLQSAEVANGILYTSSEDIEAEKIPTLTKQGDRIVNSNDVISTIYRYSKEKYGVTIMDSSGKVKVRYDSNTENLMQNYYSIESGLDEYINQLNLNTKTTYISNNELFDRNVLETIYSFSLICLIIICI